MAPIYKKLDDAIKAVGAAEGVIYIFDLARTPIPYVNETSVSYTHLDVYKRQVMLYQLSYFRVFSTGAKINSLLVSAKSFRRCV